MPTSLSLKEEKKKESSKKSTLPSSADGDSSGSRDMDFSAKGIALLEDIYAQNKKIKRRLAWMVFGSYLRLFIILVPLVLSIIYLPALFQKFQEQYSTLLSSPEQMESVIELFSQFSDQDKARAAEALSSFSPEEIEAMKQQYLSQ